MAAAVTSVGWTPLPPPMLLQVVEVFQSWSMRWTSTGLVVLPVEAMAQSLSLAERTGASAGIWLAALPMRVSKRRRDWAGWLPAVALVSMSTVSGVVVE